MSALYARATLAQLTAARELVKLALAEEPNEAKRKELGEADREIGWMEAHGSLVFLLRGSVEALRARALPGGARDVGAGAWLALNENGGSA